MNYHKIYNQIIYDPRNNILTGYIEKHHIIPKSLGGSNASDNIVRLSCRQHFIVHWLLTKMFEGKDKSKMINAFWSMIRKGGKTQRIVSSFQYEIARKIFSKNLTDQNLQASSNGVHPFQGDTGRKMQKLRVENGTHHLLTMSKKRALAGTHHAQGEKGSKYFREIQLRKVREGRHHFQNREWSSKRASQLNKKLVEEGRHQFLGGDFQRNLWKNPELYKRRVRNIAIAGRRRFALKRYNEGKTLSEMDVNILKNEGLIL